MTDFVKPHALPNEPVIGLFSPSEPLNDKRIARLNRNLDSLSGTLRFRAARSTFAADAYMAGTPEQRLSDLRELLEDTSVHALLSTWGGKSAVQLLAKFPYTQALKRCIPILGFSDVAAILNFVSFKTGLVTFYGPNVAGKLDESRHASLTELYKKSSWPTSFLGSAASAVSTIFRQGEGTGVLIGGNLSTFAAIYPLLLAHNLEIPQKLIFFWESGNGRPQEIDQSLTVLEALGFFKRVQGMIVGTVGVSEVPAVKPSTDLGLSVLRPVAKYNFPVLSCPTFGHSDLENPIIPIGVPAKLTVTSSHIQSVLLEDPVAR